MAVIAAGGVFALHNNPEPSNIVVNVVHRTTVERSTLPSFERQMLWSIYLKFDLSTNSFVDVSIKYLGNVSISRSNNTLIMIDESK